MNKINIEDLQKIDLRVGTIISAEKIEGSEKLLKLEVDIGSEKRQILSGIANFYNAEDLIGKQIIVVANLEPRKMMGLESQGMLLAADSEGKAILITPVASAENGASVI